MFVEMRHVPAPMLQLVDGRVENRGVVPPVHCRRVGRIAVQRDQSLHVHSVEQYSGVASLVLHLSELGERNFWRLLERVVPVAPYLSHLLSFWMTWTA